MGILDNLEAYLDFGNDKPNLAVKIFSETVCKDCACKPETESKPMSVTDNMGREIFWEEAGRPNP